ncbi:MAG: helix-turn-helix transcriptional regulator [Candidatus Limnocylindrales bacterium]|jgi:transcriptional regulator with XRE-family HTH domain
MKKSKPLYPRQQRAASELGARLRLARERRRMPAAELAERADTSRMTIHRLERGDTSVSLGVLVRVLGVLGLVDDLGAVARDDVLGRQLQDAALPRPSRSLR